MTCRDVCFFPDMRGGSQIDQISRCSQQHLISIHNWSSSSFAACDPFARSPAAVCCCTPHGRFGLFRKGVWKACGESDNSPRMTVCYTAVAPSQTQQVVCATTCSTSCRARPAPVSHTVARAGHCHPSLCTFVPKVTSSKTRLVARVADVEGPFYETRDEKEFCTEAVCVFASAVRFSQCGTRVLKLCSYVACTPQSCSTPGTGPPDTCCVVAGLLGRPDGGRRHGQPAA